MSVTPRSIAVPIVTAAVIMTFWGATPVMTRIAIRDLDPLVVAVLRTVVAGAIALPLLAAMRAGLPTTRDQRVLLAISSVTGFVLFPLLFTFGQQRTSAMHGGMILAALPILTGVYAALLQRRRPSQRWIAGCALALTGEFAIVVLRAGRGDDATIAGDLLVVVSALFVSAGYVAGARLGELGYRSLSTTFWGVALAAIALAPAVPAFVIRDGWPQAGAKSWGAVLFLAIMTSIVGYVGWYWALARGGIGRIATIQFLQPFSGIALAALVLHERLTWQLGVASAAILVGVAVAQRGAGQYGDVDRRREELGHQVSDNRRSATHER